MIEQRLYPGNKVEFYFFLFLGIICNPFFCMGLVPLLLLAIDYVPVLLQIIFWILAGICWFRFMTFFIYSFDSPTNSNLDNYKTLSHDLKYVPDPVVDLIDCSLKMRNVRGSNFYFSYLKVVAKKVHKILYKKSKPDNSTFILAVQKLKSIDSDFKNDKIYKEIARKRDYQLKNLNELIPLAINIVNNDKILKYPDLYEDIYDEINDTIDFVFKLTKYYKRMARKLDKDEAHLELKKIQQQNEDFKKLNIY